MAKSAFEVILVEFFQILLPLREKLAPDHFIDFMAELGWKWPQDTVIDFSECYRTLELKMLERNIF